MSGLRAFAIAGFCIVVMNLIEFYRIAVNAGWACYIEDVYLWLSDFRTFIIPAILCAFLAFKCRGIAFIVLLLLSGSFLFDAIQMTWPGGNLYGWKAECISLLLSIAAAFYWDRNRVKS